MMVCSFLKLNQETLPVFIVTQRMTSISGEVCILLILKQYAFTTPVPNRCFGPYSNLQFVLNDVTLTMILEPAAVGNIFGGYFKILIMIISNIIITYTTLL